MTEYWYNLSNNVGGFVKEEDVNPGERKLLGFVQSFRSAVGALVVLKLVQSRVVLGGEVKLL